LEGELVRSILIFAGLGITIGILAGFFGIGGGALMVPALVILAGMTQHQAQGTSLAALVYPVGLLGAISYFRGGHVNILGAAILGLGVMVGSYFGAERAVEVPDAVLRRAFAIFLILIAVRMFFKGD